MAFCFKERVTMNLALLELGFRPTTYFATGEDVFSKKTFGRFTHEFNIFLTVS